MSDTAYHEPPHLIVVDDPACRRAYGPFRTAEHAAGCFARSADILDPGSHGTRVFPLSPPLTLPGTTPPSPQPDTRDGCRHVLLVARPVTDDAVLVGPFTTAGAAAAWWAAQQPGFPGAQVDLLPVLPPPVPAAGTPPAVVRVGPRYPHDTAALPTHPTLG